MKAFLNFLKDTKEHFSYWFKVVVFRVNNFKHSYNMLYFIHINTFMVHQFQVMAEMRDNSNISRDLFSLETGPSLDVCFYSGCIVGGVRFQTLEHNFRRTTQNSGVMVIGEGSVWSVVPTTIFILRCFG